MFTNFVKRLGPDKYEMSIRRFITIVEREMSRDKSSIIDSGSSFPPLPEKGGGRGPREGEFWMKGSTLLAVPGPENHINFDFAQMIYVYPEKFGMTIEQVIDEVARTDEFTANVLRRWRAGEFDSLQMDRRPASHAGGRSSGLRLMFSRGWSFVESRIDRISMITTREILRSAVSDLAGNFPLINTEEITVSIHKARNGMSEWTETVTFRKEDFAAMAGHFSALLHWAGTGEAPVQNYGYIARSRLGDLSNGIESEIGHVQHGNALYADRHRLFFLNGSPTTRYEVVRQGRQNFVRFPTKYLDGLRSTYDGAHRAYCAYSDKPFVIPPEALQVWSGRAWVPMK